jgi:hypothetical protein
MWVLTLCCRQATILVGLGNWLLGGVPGGLPMHERQRPVRQAAGIEWPFWVHGQVARRSCRCRGGCCCDLRGLCQPGQVAHGLPRAVLVVPRPHTRMHVHARGTETGMREPTTTSGSSMCVTACGWWSGSSAALRLHKVDCDPGNVRIQGT